MVATVFDTFVMVDWSAAATPAGEQGQPGGIWIAVGADDEPATVRPARTRGQARAVLAEILARAVSAGRRVLVGVDVCLGYPAGTAAALGAGDAAADEPPWNAMWRLVAARLNDDPDSNANDRFHLAAALNAALGRDAGPFWGRPHGAEAADTLQATRPVFPVRVPGPPATRLAELRHTEVLLRRAGHQPKSVWQVAYAGSVGGQTLTALPHLLALRNDARLADSMLLWPFETGFDLPIGRSPLVVLAEVYPSTLEVLPERHAVHDAAQVLTMIDVARERRDDGSLWHAFAPPRGADPAALAAAQLEEGWVLPLEPLRLPLPDPADTSLTARPEAPRRGSRATVPPAPGGTGPGWDRAWPIPGEAIRHALHGYLAAVTAPRGLEARTHCPPWTGAELTAHLVATVRRFTTCLLRTRSGDPRPPFPPDRLDAENLAQVQAFDGAPERMLAAEVECFLGLLADPAEPMAHQRGLIPVGLQCRWLLGELLLHRADLATPGAAWWPPADDLAELLIPAYAIFTPDPRDGRPGHAWAALRRMTGRR